LSDQAGHHLQWHLLHQEEPPVAIIFAEDGQDDPADPAALSSSYARAPSSSPGSSTSFELKGKQLVRKKEERSRKIETGREDTPYCQEEPQNICLKERIQRANYLLDPESGAWLEPPGPPSTSSGLSGGSWTGHRCQLGMTIGEGVQELLPGGRRGRGSNSMSNS
jgi:hypothetical protein